MRTRPHGPVQRRSEQRGPEQRRPVDRRPVDHRPRGWERYPPGQTDDHLDFPNARDSKTARVEAVLLTADEPLTARKIALTAGLADAAEARGYLKRLSEMYDADGTAFQISEIAGGFQLLTRPAYQPWLVRMELGGSDVKLTPAAMETLAVVAYRQPIMRADVEAVRGVGCGELLTQLIEKGLVKIVGRHESLGRPVLYGTTKRFLMAFGLNSLRDLPDADGFRKG